MLLQTNSYIVPKDKRTEHARLVKRFKQAMSRLGLTDFEVYEQAGPNWSAEIGGRFVQIMRFRDREHQRAVRAAEEADSSAQDLIREFCELVQFHYQQQQGLATTAYYLNTASPTASPLQVAGPAALNGVDADELNDAAHPSPQPPAAPFPTGTPARASARGDVDE